MTEQAIEQALIEKLGDFKYGYRSDIRDRAILKQDFREKLEALNCVHLADGQIELKTLTISPRFGLTDCTLMPHYAVSTIHWL